ncbi:MAG TPA: prepilin-type N-terminal cleavage/methylation domain-containing protein [Chthoniobacteraceae bacterium]|nr:prepilin-type N-terminal cleavage/methylation domain-containing protein [Chthoniobacteraceae bacterium]
MYIGRSTFIKHCARRAFTLMEVMLALAILTLLVGSLFGIVDATFRATQSLRDRQDRNRETSAFLSLCRKTFANLPATASFQARVVSAGQHSSTELIFRNAPGLLDWGGNENAYASTILGVRVDAGGFLGIGILQGTDAQTDAYLDGGDAPRPWLILLSEFHDVKWEFYDPGSAMWENDWTNTSARPTYARLTLAAAGETNEYVFRVTPVVKP